MTKNLCKCKKFRNFEQNSKIMEENKNNQTLLQAENIINRHMLWAMAAASFPIHLVDTIGLIFIQNDLIKQLSRLYGFDYDKNVGKTLVSTIITSSTAKGVSLLFGKNKVVDRFTFVLLAGAFTYGIGRLFITYFEQGISLIDIDFKKGEELFSDLFDVGKGKAEDILDKD